MFRLLNPPPSSLPILSLWVIPVHQPCYSFILFLVDLGVELGNLFDFFLVSWGKLVLLGTFPLALLLLSPIGFELLCFHFHSFLYIFLFLFLFLLYFFFWLFRSVLFSLHMFVFLTDFFPLSLTSNLITLWSEKRLEMISVCLNLPRLDLRPRMWSILEKIFCVHLRKRWNSLFWGEMSYRYQLGLTGPLHHLKFVFPC